MLRMPSRMHSQSWITTAAVGLLAWMALGLAGCELGGSEDDSGAGVQPPGQISQLTCRPKDGKVGLAWGPAANAFAYRIARAEGDGQPVLLGQASGAAFTDYTAEAGAAYRYTVTPLGLEAEGATSGPCDIVVAAGDGPDAPEGLVCRAKDGKLDVAWPPVPGASAYRVYRLGPGGPITQVAETPALAHADLALQNGVVYEYAVVALDGRGRASAESERCSATPGPRVVGDAPPAVADLACRGKNDKADLTWTPVEGASLYRVFRARDGGAPEAVGETTGGVFADFGLDLGVPYTWTVASVGPGGAASAPSTGCGLTPAGRGTGPVNQPPRITSQPLTSALEDHVYYDTVSATDPEGETVTYSLVDAPGGMTIDPETGFLRWTPSTSQIGPSAVEVRATDPQGAFDSQAFVVTAEDFDEPPIITSVPGRSAPAGEAYSYQVAAFDPEGQDLSYGFAAAAPPGMTIDAESGLVTWTPQATDAGNPRIEVRASDPAGQFDVQRYTLTVSSDPLDLLSPEGERVVRPGETLQLQLVANIEGVGFRVTPALANSKLADGVFTFTPELAQEGTYDLGFEAVLGDQRDVNPVRIRVERDNAPPTLTALAPQEIEEGESLRLAVSGEDPDGDALSFSAPGLELANAVFDEITRTFSFTPDFEQAGSYDVTLSVSDGRDSATGTLAITVLDAAPPVEDINLAVDPPQSPTFLPSQTISGSLDGTTQTGVETAPLVVGLSPVNVRQGRSATVTVTGRDTAFAPGVVTADFGAGITVTSLEVLSPTELRAEVAAAADAALGIRTVRVRQEGIEALSVVAFRVEPGAAVLTGVLRDDFTGQPLANARVSIQGSNVSVVTGADGSFTLEGVPAGEQQVVVTTQDYNVKTLDLAFQANQDVGLEDPVELRALARPFSVGGDLPRAQTLASVLDRGVSDQDGGLDFEQARAVVIDTMLAIGGDEVGVIDEAGNQLNPDLIGSGMLSLAPPAVDYFAERLIYGETWTFGELAVALEGTFGWLYPTLTQELLQRRLQAAADQAWANPNDPFNTLAILLLNDGRTLSPRPPVVTQETTFNALQAFLYVSAFLASNLDTLERELDSLLASQGIDPNQVLIDAGFDPELLDTADAGPSMAERLAARAGAALGAALVPFAHAQAGGDPSEPNTARDGPRRSRWGAVAGEFPAALGNAVIAGVLAIAITGVLAVCGLFGAVFTAGAVALAFGTAFLSALFAKLLITFMADPNAVADFTPTQPTILANASAKPAGQGKIRIPFERSQSDLRADELARTEGQGVETFYSNVVQFDPGETDPRRFEYRYHLWKLSSPETPVRLGAAAGAKLISTRTQPVRGSGGQLLQFVIPKSEETVSEGTNYFTVVTVQFYRRVYNVDPDLDPDDDKAYKKALQIVYSDLDLPPPPQQVAQFAGSSAQSNTWSNAFTFSPKAVINGQSQIQDLIEQRRAAIDQIQQEINAGWAAQRSAQRSARGNWNTTALGYANQAQATDDLIRRLEDELTDLRLARGNLIDNQITASHRNIQLAVAGYFQDPANAAKTESQILADFADASRPPGSTVAPLLANAGPEANAAFREMVREASNNVVLENRLRQLVAEEQTLTKARKQLFEAKRTAELSGRPVETGLDRIDLLGTDPPRSFTFPDTVSPNISDQAFQEVLGELQTERIANSARKNFAEQTLRARDAVLDAVIEDFQFTYFDVDDEAFRNLGFEIEAKRTAHAEAVRQKQRLLRESQAAVAEIELIDATESAARQQGAPVIGLDGRPSAELTDVNLVRQIESLEQPRSFASVGSPSKFRTIAAETFGVATDVGVSAWEARNKILILRSKPSDVITVNVQDGEVIVGDAGAPAPRAQDAQTLLASRHQPIELHPALPEVAEQSYAVRAFFPSRALPLARGTLVMDDSGNIVGRPPFGSLRWHRERDADRRAGVAPTPVQFQGSQGFPAQFETEKISTDFLAIWHGTGPQGENGKAGSLVRDYPFTDAEAVILNAGFPSDVMAVDSRGAVYLINGNSTLKYGGRVFKYAGDPVVREHVGSVSYYSLQLQYGRPTQPIAMEAGEGWTDEYGLVEDLFIAERDPGIYIDSGIQGVNRLLRLAIHQTTRIPAFANGQNRNRLVAQPYAEHPDFQFTGPSDIEVDRVRRSGGANVPYNLYLSDEENIFVISDADSDGVGEVAKVVDVSGRRWSGLAVDALGNLLFADYNSGEVFLLATEELDSILVSGSPISSDQALDQRAYLVKVGLQRPGDVEFDTWEQRYLVSTQAGYEAFNAPIVGRLQSDVTAMKIDVIGRSVPVTIRGDRGNVFLAGNSSEGPYGKRVRIRYQVRDPETLRKENREATYNTVPLGATIIRDPL